MRLLIVFFIVFICKQGSGTTYECNTTVSCGCSASSTVLARIIGGEPADHESWSWTVSLREGGEHICGGSILSPLFIVTAAHCINDVTDLASITILAGSDKLVPSSSNKVYQIRSIAQIYEHADYDADTKINDIALLRLSSPLNMTSANLKPICLPTGTTVQPPDNISMVAVGWGVTSMFSDTASPILRQVTVQSIATTVDNCSSTIYNSQFQFCAGLTSGGKDTCQGDSGGPLMAFVNGLWQLDGLTSYGYGCALPGHPGVYTRVSAYVTWIESIIQSYEINTTTTTSTKKKRTSTTVTARKTSQTTTIYKTTSSYKSLLDSTLETTSSYINPSTKADFQAESLSQIRNDAKHATIQSLFLVFFLLIVTSTYSIRLLFLL